MTLPDSTQVVHELPRALRPAFAPLVKRALGMGVGVLGALFLCGLAIHGMATDPAEALGVWLLGDNFLFGYRATPIGAIIGLAWGFGLGFALGWTLAFTRNFLLTMWIAIVGARERLRANRDFLDQM